MLQAQSPLHARQKFRSPLSLVLYVDVSTGDNDVPVRPAAEERRLVEAVCQRIRAANEYGLLAMAPTLDADVLPRLSGESLLRLAETVEECAPWLIRNMPALARHHALLQRAGELAQTYSQEHLDDLLATLREELQR